MIRDNVISMSCPAVTHHHGHLVQRRLPVEEDDVSIPQVPLYLHHCKSFWPKSMLQKPELRQRFWQIE